MATVANYWLQPRPAFAQVHRLLCAVWHALQVVLQLWLPIGAKALPACIDCFVTDALLHDCSSLATWSILSATVPEGVEVSYCSGSKGGGMDGWQVVRQ
jgi:hypothetical protein